MATTTRQRLAGGFVIGVAALAFYIGTQFKGPGLGGSGSGDGGPTPGQSTSPSTSTTPVESELVGDEATLVTTSVPPIAFPATPSSPLVVVVISGSQYLLSTTGDETQATPAELTDVARAAIAASGDGQGIRVRIFRKKDATAGAYVDLFAKLGEAGIPTEAIQDKKEFLDQ